MRVAVLSLTRDRLDYTQHCFTTLRENAGIPYDHYVYDQGSTDGTPQWLQYGPYAAVVFGKTNIGISRGMNHLLDIARGYDAHVTFDNDCEVTMYGTLETAARVAVEGNWIISPTVQGLKYPPSPGPETMVAGERVGPYMEMGGIFRAMPAAFVDGFRFTETNPLWGYDERDVGREAGPRGFGSGYLLDWFVTHYETTVGQEQRYPEYFGRKLAEMR